MQERESWSTRTLIVLQHLDPRRLSLLFLLLHGNLQYARGLFLLLTLFLLLIIIIFLWTAAVRLFPFLLDLGVEDS
jgi:hypothetical protein